MKAPKLSFKKKHIVCFGDSNTHGWCADAADCMDGGNRFNEYERWTCLLESLLGEEYKVLEEGMPGRNTVFPDPIYEENFCGIDVLAPILMTHQPVDLLIIMLGTNDCRDMFNANPDLIARGMERLARRVAVIDCLGKKPNILLISPAPIKPYVANHWEGAGMGPGCTERSRGLAAAYRRKAEELGCAFFDAAAVAEINDVDWMHLTSVGHRVLADALAPLVKGLTCMA